MSETTLLGIGPSDLYKAVLARDRRFDGRMFVGGYAAVLLWHSLSDPRDRRLQGEKNSGTISK